MNNRSSFFRILLLVSGSFLLFPALAFAYIDPGTGATFVGSMAPLIMGVIGGIFAFVLKVFWHPLKRLFGCGTCEDAGDGGAEASTEEKAE